MNEVATNGHDTSINFTSDQLDLIRRTVAKDASIDEMKLFLYRAKNMGLDPLKPGQIYFSKYGNGPGSVIVGIEGFRSIAARTGKVRGVSRGIIRNEKGLAVSAWCEIHRSDWTHPAREEVSMVEYNTGRATWKTMPETMLKKVAECAALRMAFPDDLGGVYAPEEMDQADKRSERVAPEEPGANDGNTEPTGYRITFGKFAQRSLEEVGVDQLRGYVNYLEAKAEKDGKQITGKVAEFITLASDYIASFENSNPENEESSVGFDA